MYMDSSTEYYSTISTMKVILLFALFGLSFCLDSDTTSCSVSKTEYADGKKCLEQALKKSAATLEAFGKFLCQYYKAKETEGANLDAYNAAAKEFVKLAECIGCDIGQFLGNDIAFEIVFKEFAEAIMEVGRKIVILKNAAGVGALTEKGFCFLVGDLMTSECTNKILAYLLPGSISVLEDTYCKLRSGATAEAAVIFADILRQTGCAGDDQLETGQTLEDLLGSLGDLLLPFIEKTLILTQQVPLLGDALCLVANPKIPKVPVLPARL